MHSLKFRIRFIGLVESQAVHSNFDGPTHSKQVILQLLQIKVTLSLYVPLGQIQSLLKNIVK